jgi:anti-sigma factor RsiW
LTVHSAAITCRQLIDVLTDYVEDALGPSLRAEFDRHLDVCPSCRAYLDGYRRTIALGRAAYAPHEADRPAKAPDGVLDAVRAVIALAACTRE